MPRTAPGSEPPYRRIAAEIRRRIDLGELRPGDPVPSARRITREHGVAIATATKVLALLRAEGLVLTRPGAGTVVAPGRTETHGTRRAAERAEPELSRERVVRSAIALADAGGLPAVSMRQIAADLDVATMSLYRHVRGRDELILTMADIALADAPLPAVQPAGWRARLELLAWAQWATYRRHRWLPHVISIARPQMMPHGMAHTEWALRATSGLGLDRQLRWHVAITLMAYVRGIATNLEMRAQAEQDTGLTDDQWVDRQEATLRQMIAAGGFSTMAALTAEGDVDLDLETVFEFGLRRLLDGCATLIERRPEDGVSPGR
ncbi:TetR/AcrR family transcriptional regulator C-terminal domain-containing protein [Micromonospora sp. 4G57]|uniref:TetR/AcrR family transcriptional regulator C-terminal domain-containing protein n=1 Tax=Micromonospora sicca TaxID=2202420 RepID=A0ABU5JCP2_9ACTN|nr:MULTISPECIES: TetR/AcrR family transcriptional regulator C-terminal domain-containing protein [unclassified Micromonospora]MDZ5444477.1 TetR/AcrR family transcriptional regulator C-terminal domain-containing protein [Micromonospora sp. 4G57]MDZ5490361.1 TetR/AcrR family transcriptional regulator C-terminal domain-containing protein [Micromonospora sp. 4G53]